MRKERLTTTVDRELIQAGMAAVAAGRASSLSAWVNAALTEQAARDRRLAAMAAAVAAYEKIHGEITEAEMAGQERSDRQRSTVVRGGDLALPPPTRRSQAG